MTVTQRGVAAVLFDLDDTLYPQRDWLAGAWSAVSEEASAFGVDPTTFRDALVAVAAEGSDRGMIIDRALDAIHASVPIPPLIAAFWSYRAPELNPYPGVRDGLARLRRRVRLAVVTDGEPEVQAAKLHALGFGSTFDAVVFSDELGRARRKPHPAPFLLALERLEVEAEYAVFVGDRPDKDIAGAQAAGIRAVRVRTGEYASMACDRPPWMEAPSAAEAVDALEANLPSQPHHPNRANLEISHGTGNCHRPSPVG